MDMSVQDLKGLPLLSTLPEQALSALLTGARSMTLDKGTLLHLEGETCLRLDVVLSGLLAVERLGEDGSQLQVAVFGKGACVGGNLLFSSSPVYSFTVRALATTRLLLLDKQELFDLFKAHPGFLLQYLKEVSDHTARLEGRVRHYSNLPIKKRLLNYLDAQARAQGRSRLLLPLSKTALATQLGVHRSSLSRVLQGLRAEGVLDFDRHSILLKKRPPT